MRAARIQNSIIDLNKGIASCEKQLSRVIKVKENENHRVKATLPKSRSSVSNKNTSHAVSARKTASKDPDRLRQSVQNVVTPRVYKTPSRISGSIDKTLVHKEVIGDGMGSTRVEVVVRTKPCKKRSRSVNTAQGTSLKARSVSEGVSKKSPMSVCQQPEDKPRTPKGSSSWADILQRQSSFSRGLRKERHGSKSTKKHPGRPRELKYESSEGISSENEYENLIAAASKEKTSSYQKSSNKMNENLKKQDETDGYCSIFNPVRTLNFLIKELRGTIHKDCDENMHRIVEDMEKAVHLIPAGDTVSPPTQQTLQPHTSGSTGAPFRRQSSLANASVNVSSNASVVENTKMSDPKSSVTVSGAAQLVENLFSTVAHLTQFTKSSCSGTTLAAPQPHSQPQTSGVFPLDPTAAMLQSQLQLGCKQLEDTCKQMEETCENLRRQRDQLNEDLRSKAKQLEAVLSKNQQLTVYAADLRQELIRVQQSAEALQQENEKNLLTAKSQLKECQERESKMRSRFEEVMRENEQSALELQLSRLEKDKMHVLVANKDLEVAKLKKEIIDIHALVAEQLASLRVVSDQNFILNKLDEMLQTSGQINDTATDESLSGTLTEHNRHEQSKQLSHVPHNGAGEGNKARPVCSSPTSSMNSSMYSSWQILSDITAAEANLLFECQRKAGTSSNRDGKLGERKNGNMNSIITSLCAAEIPAKTHSNSQNMRDSHMERLERKTNPGKHKITAESLKAGLQDMFDELKKETAEAVNISLPSPPKEFTAMPEPLGISQWSELSASESVMLHTSDDSHSEYV